MIEGIIRLVRFVIGIPKLMVKLGVLAIIISIILKLLGYELP